MCAVALFGHHLLRTLILTVDWIHGVHSSDILFYGAYSILRFDLHFSAPFDTQRFWSFPWERKYPRLWMHKNRSWYWKNWWLHNSLVRNPQNSGKIQLKCTPAPFITILSLQQLQPSVFLQLYIENHSLFSICGTVRKKKPLFLMSNKHITILHHFWLLLLLSLERCIWSLSLFSLKWSPAEKGGELRQNKWHFVRLPV